MSRNIGNQPSDAARKPIVPGNAGIAALDPNASRQEAERETAGEELKHSNASSSTVDTAKKQRKQKEQPDPMVEDSRVDEAAWESFPASDPPSHGGSTSTPSKPR